MARTNTSPSPSLMKKKRMLASRQQQQKMQKQQLQQQQQQQQLQQPLTNGMTNPDYQQQQQQQEEQELILTASASSSQIRLHLPSQQQQLPQSQSPTNAMSLTRPSVHSRRRSDGGGGGGGMTSSSSVSSAGGPPRIPPTAAAAATTSQSTSVPLQPVFHPVVSNNNNNNNNTSSSTDMSFFRRFSTDASHAMADVYSHWFLGDDAGKSMQFPVCLHNHNHPNLTLASRITFLEINGRAYVHSVAPGSDAAQAGILPQDAVQYAMVVGVGMPEEAAAAATNPHDATATASNNNKKKTLSDAQLCQQVVDAEQSGIRISYDEFRAMVIRTLDPTQSAFLSPPTYRSNGGSSSSALCGGGGGTNFWTTFGSSSGPPSDYHNHDLDPYHPPLLGDLPVSTPATPLSTAAAPPGASSPDIPANVCVPSGRNPRGTSSSPNNNTTKNTLTTRAVQSFHATTEPEPNHNQNNNINGNGGAGPRLVLCLRRTRQRKVGVPSHVSSWSFRLDDECDFATQLVQRLAPTQDMELPNPDTWQELVHDGTDWLLGNGSILPPRTSHSNNTTSHNGGGGHPTTTTDGPDWNQEPPSIQNGMDEEDDDDDDGDDDHHDDGLSIPLDDMERERAKKLAQLRSRMAAEAMLKQQQALYAGANSSGDRTEDVEAVTIRGMIQKAVGLAFVRSSKVVLGVSVHAGSGIVLARLSDGTWSAPSAIGTWGIGLGLQFGLEVAEYIFILQTAEALEHFRRGGSFTVGGNVGAAVAGVGREAYGAASVGGTVCGSTSTVLMKDDEYNHSHDEGLGSAGGGGGAALAPGATNAVVVPSSTSPSGLAIAPIVAYAKSQGLYIGVSLEGSRIFTRNDINRRAYKFWSGKNVTAHDILTGKVATPHEAEALYAALHSVEFTHEMSCLPRPPEILRNNSSQPWSYQTCTLSQTRTPFSFLANSQKNHNSSNNNINNSKDNHNNNHNSHPNASTSSSSLSQEELEELETFETQFKAFMYGGVSVQRVIPEGHAGSSSSSMPRTTKERRTLWLMLPEVGSLRLGFVSKLSDGEGVISNKSSTQRAQRNDIRNAHHQHHHNGNGMMMHPPPMMMGGNPALQARSTASAAADHDTVGSEEVTLDSALRTQGGDGTQTVSSLPHNVRTNNVQLSRKHSVALTDVTLLTQDPPKHVVGGNYYNKFFDKSKKKKKKNQDSLNNTTSYDKMEHLRIISIQDVHGTQLLFLANNFREAELLVCGLKLLLERETTRLNIRGGIPRASLQQHQYHNSSRGGPLQSMVHSTMRSRRQQQQSQRPSSSSSSNYSNHSGGRQQQQHHASDTESVSVTADELSNLNNDGTTATLSAPRTWGNVPGRQYMRQAAAASATPEQAPQPGVPQYTHGQPLERRVADQVRLPLPLPLCRVLLLDSTSPVITKWEHDRGDSQFEKTEWTFPPSTPRELEHHASEHQLIASGSMCEAHRTVVFQRLRYGTVVRLTETHTVEADDPNELVLSITERNPRRGFSIKVRILLRPSVSYNNHHRNNKGGEEEDASKSCEASVIATIRPVGKDMSNQAAVHKAFLLVVDEIRDRYGVQGKGLLAGFLNVVDDMADGSHSSSNNKNNNSSNKISSKKQPFYGVSPPPQTLTTNTSSATNSRRPNGSTGGTAMSSGHNNRTAAHQFVPPTAASSRVSAQGKVTLPAPSVSSPTKAKSSYARSGSGTSSSSSPSSKDVNSNSASTQRKSNTSIAAGALGGGGNGGSNGPANAAYPPVMGMTDSGRDSPETTNNIRPSTPSLISQVPESDPAKRLTAKTVVPRSDEFELPPRKSSAPSQEESKDPVVIEVKPLPKIRLSLMPSPREEDEELDSGNESPTGGGGGRSKGKKKGRSSRKSKNSGDGHRKSSRRSNGSKKIANV